jgi:hypothetical protein
LIFYKALDELDLMKMIQKILNLKYGRYWILSSFVI